MAEKKINGRTFKVNRLLASEALVLQARVFKVFGPAISSFGEIMQGHGTDKTEEQKARSNSAAMAALAGVIRELDPREYAKLISDIVSVAMIERGNGDYGHCDLDGDFQDDQQEDILPVVLFVLREQFGSFFKGLPGAGSLGNLLKA